MRVGVAPRARCLLWLALFVSKADPYSLPKQFTAKMAKNRVLVSLDACSLPNQILTFSISLLFLLIPAARRMFLHSSTL